MVKANGAFNGGNVKQMNFRARNLGAKENTNEGGSGSRSVTGNFLHTSPAGCREENNNEDFFQSSNSGDKSAQNQICGVSDTQGRQSAKVRAERDIRENELGVVSQKAEADTESPTPIQIDEPNSVTRVGERSMLQDSCQSTSNVDNNNEDKPTQDTALGLKARRKSRTSSSLKSQEKPKRKGPNKKYSP